MKTTITSDQLRHVVESVSESNYGNNLIFNREPEGNGKWRHFTLRVNHSNRLGARRSHTGRKMVSACWHAHRDVMILLFTLYPDAQLHSALAAYNGADEFNDKFEATGEQNIGSMCQPLSMFNACECEL